MKEYSHQVHLYEPVYNERSRILILGTFPSVKSRENGFYYGHPQNRFWKVMAALAGSPVPVSIEEKKLLLLDHGFALWDVVASCDIVGSSDASIANVVPTDIRKILDAAPIGKICANGTTAGKLYDRYQKKQCGREILLLPSTSPANASWTLQALTDRWRELIM